MLTCKHAKFTLPPRITYLNCSYLSPMLKSVEKVGIRALRLKRNPAGLTPQDFFKDSESLRAAYARLIHVKDPKRIVIIPSVSYGMANVAANMKLGKGQHVLVAAEQFPSNYYTWQRLCSEAGAEVKVISPPDSLKDRGKIWNERILEGIDRNTKAVAIAHTHWADGTKFNLEAIRKRTREVDALLIVDGTQSVGAMPFDVRKIQPDALVCSGYKWLMVPYGIGLAYYGEYFNDGRPIEENWINRLNSEDFSGLVNYQSEYQPGALRYEVGEHSSFIHVPMMLKAIEQLNKWGIESIQEYCASITQDAVRKLRERDFWIEDEHFRGHHLIGIRLPQHMDLQQVKDTFARNKIYVSFRGNAIRVAPNVYNDEKDLKKLVKALGR
jgi:selenocysteine lyase/cysteine desulfurase